MAHPSSRFATAITSTQLQLPPCSFIFCCLVCMNRVEHNNNHVNIPFCPSISNATYCARRILEAERLRKRCTNVEELAHLGRNQLLSMIICPNKPEPFQIRQQINGNSIIHAFPFASPHRSALPSNWFSLYYSDLPPFRCQNHFPI